MRRLLFQFHLYLGLFAGAVFVLLGITGSLLVFHDTIDETLNPVEVTTEPGAKFLPVGEILEAAERARPDAATPFRIIMPHRDRGVAKVWSTLAGEEEAFLITNVDPGSREVLNHHVWGDTLMSFIYKLHYDLQLGHAGETVVGVAGILMLVSIASGIYLWWPALGQVSRAFAIRLPARGYRLHFELHKTFGFYSAVLLFVIAFSGIYLVFPEQVTKLVGAALPVSDEPTDLQSTPRSGAKRIGPDRAVANARNRFPHAELDRVGLPAGRHGVYEVGLRQPNEVQESYGQTQVWVDQYSGEVLAARDYREFGAGDLLLGWQFSLHNGEAFGLLGRWVVFVLGLVPLALYVTGFTLWWKSRKARKRRRLPASLSQATR